MVLIPYGRDETPPTYNVQTVRVTVQEKKEEEIKVTLGFSNWQACGQEKEKRGRNEGRQAPEYSFSPIHSPQSNQILTGGNYRRQIRRV